MLINPTDKKLDIIILAGQSNAEGYGYGPCEEPYIPDPRIMSMRDTDNYGYVVDDKPRETFNITLPRTYLINVTEERQTTRAKIGCLALSFAKKYLAKYTAPDRSLLIIHTAVGATGFAKGNWGIDGVLYKRLIRMTELALSMNKENRVCAMLWHQGEQDAGLPQELTAEQRHDRHVKNLGDMLSDFRLRFGNCPIIMGGFTDKWSSGAPNAQIIVNAMVDVCNQLGNATVVSSAGLESNSTVMANTDHIHFSRNSLRLLGERYFDGYELFKV